MSVRVLVVDDNPAITEMFQFMLQGSCAEVVATARDYDTAFKAYDTHKPDLVLLDLTLPGKSGLEILKELLQKYERAKVVIVTANAQKKIRAQVLAAGAAEMLVKPLSVKDLLKTINRLFPSK